MKRAVQQQTMATQERSSIVKVPPIKTQGIKTKLVNFILTSVKWGDKGRWIEPFLGSGVVLFNASPKNALGSETNIHIIDFYKALQKKKITPESIREYLEFEGAKLHKDGESHYYEIRDRFNKDFNSLDFLFLNRAGFNGLMRFNSKGKFNVPFCRKTSRFSKSYITKITNQSTWICATLQTHRSWMFTTNDWKQTLLDATKNDFIYLDPPYSGRSANYYDVWDENAITELSRMLESVPCKFALSLWYKNKYRKNPDIQLFKNYEIKTFEHFYHLGSTEDLRHPMIEALIIKN